jgi:hypothetical protein
MGDVGGFRRERKGLEIDGDGALEVEGKRGVRC